MIEILGLVAALAPFVSRFSRDLEGSPATGEQKRKAVLDLVGTVYEGARRLGVLDGVKEIRGVAWVQLEPLAGILVDATVAAYKATGVFVSRVK